MVPAQSFLLGVNYSERIPKWAGSQAAPSRPAVTVATDSQGFLYLLTNGQSQGASDATYFIMKLTPAGDQTIYWITLNLHVSGMVMDPAGNVYVAQTGIRPAERGSNCDFRRFYAGSHAANPGRPFAQNVLRFSQRLEMAGFAHCVSMQPRQEGRFQIEVHPHSATPLDALSCEEYNFSNFRQRGGVHGCLEIWRGRAGIARR